MNKLFAMCLASVVLLYARSEGQESSLSTQLHDYSVELERFPLFVYPYEGIVNYLKASGKDSFPLFSYGSLMDKTAAERTLSSKALATRRPAIAFGVRRIFNKDAGLPKPSSPYGMPVDLEARGFLNVEKTEHLESFINGVVIDVPIEDIEPLIKREVGYDLIPVIVSDWKGVTEGKLAFSVAYILRVPPDSHYISRTVWPRAFYYQLCRDAANQYGPLFEAVWFQNTFMANGQSISAWEKCDRENDPRTKIQDRL
jgi:cation transport regulator ChaC